MAKSKNILLQGMSGAIGKQLVVKQYPHATVITSYPDMSRVQRSESQKRNSGRFSEAVQYALGISRNPQKKAEYQLAIGERKSVYRAAIREYMTRDKEDQRY